MSMISKHRSYESQENELLYHVCYYSLLPSHHEYAFNSRTLRDHLKISRYKAKKYLKSWKDQGLIRNACIGGQDEDGNVHCNHGYVITSKMEKTAMYEKAQKDVNEDINEWLKGAWE